MLHFCLFFHFRFILLRFSFVLCVCNGDAHAKANIFFVIEFSLGFFQLDIHQFGLFEDFLLQQFIVLALDPPFLQLKVLQMVGHIQ